MEHEPCTGGEGRRKRIVLSITGASGTIYGIRTLRALMAAGAEVHAIVSESGRTVLMHECGWNGHDLSAFLTSFFDFVHPGSVLNVHSESDFFAPPASGSFLHSGMVIVPCSMKTMASVASGMAGNLILRAADVCLKERRPLVMVVRETPLSLIHIENMRTLSLAGAIIMPASPSFYSFPSSVDDLVDTVVSRILDHLGIRNSLSSRWGD